MGFFVLQFVIIFEMQLILITWIHSHLHLIFLIILKLKQNVIKYFTRFIQINTEQLCSQNLFCNINL